MVNFKPIPCKGCICFPICKQRFLANCLYKLYTECKILDTFIEEDNIPRTNLVYNFFKRMI